MEFLLRAIILGSVFSAIATVVTVCGASCGNCTADLCSSRFVLAIREHDGGALRPGRWQFTLTLDGEVATATCDIGADSRSAKCDDDELPISAIIFDDPSDPYRMFQIDIDGGVDAGTDRLPEIVDVSIENEGETVIDQRVEPSYHLSKPKRCDDDCYGAIIELRTDRG